MKKGKVLIDKNDLVGKRLGKLEVISYAGWRYEHTKGGYKIRHYYTCRCDCGVVKKIRRSVLKNDKAHSCGCGRSKRH